ncbi:kinase-like domain-containing protein [Pisolithus marmoratus]|nr:kinase-like domain-containing protein [Pisolithus marmoratus]
MRVPEDAGKVRDQKSSAVKAGNFAAYFIQPPFFCDGGSDVKYETEMPWGFPIFVGTREALDVWRKYRPKSDLMVSSQGHLIPFFVSEVISMKSEDDRFRMLLQAIAAARAGKILLKKTAERKFFVVAVYLNKNMIASRYIVMQTGQDNDEPTEEFRQGNAVSIHCNDFDLTDSTEATEFAREMYNLVGELNDLADDLDRNTARTLKQIVDAAKDVLSLHSKTYPVQRTQVSRLDSIPEQGTGEEPHEDMEGGEEDELGIFGADDVQEHLSNMNSMVDFRVFGHENLAVVRRKTDDSVGYLKFVETARQREVKILQFLSGIQSPMNHTISGVGFWPVQGGTMISMPVAGARLTSLERPNEHLWSAAIQLVEGVAFMHAQLVAHMDLKPENIIIPPQGGRLSIIDFSSSILLKSEKRKFRGIAGTTGYIAPEVERGDAYQPIQADLWSCGRTLEVLCSICKPSSDRDFLLGVAAELMSEDPDHRPVMSKVQEWIASRKGEIGAETHALQSPHLVVCA